MARAWLVTSRGIAKKIKNVGCNSNIQITELGIEAKRECPNCNHVIDNSDVNVEWPGLPAGVKFDPSDLELVEHLEGKVGKGNSKPHLFIDEFILTLNEEGGICYTHPENLPGVRKDGSSFHFFHKISNAYASGPRKRRKINTATDINNNDNNNNSNNNHNNHTEHVRWHKTGKTKPVYDQTGAQKGWKKIMVLYKSAKRGSKPDKASWVMHQYHLGTGEDEKDGEIVVSKVFYQLQRQVGDRGEILDSTEEEEPDTVFAVRVGPATPMSNIPQPPRNKRNESNNYSVQILKGQDPQNLDEAPASPVVRLKDEENNNNDYYNNNNDNSAWWAGESQAIEDPNPQNLDEALLCREVLDSSFAFDPSLHFEHTNVDPGLIDPAFGLSDLNNVGLGSPPDLQLNDVQFGSQDSISSWLDRF